jgi:hypothetical protein
MEQLWHIIILVVKFNVKERSDGVIHISPGQCSSAKVNGKNDFTFLGLEACMVNKCTKILTGKQLSQSCIKNQCFGDCCICIFMASSERDV